MGVSEPEGHDGAGGNARPSAAHAHSASPAALLRELGLRPRKGLSQSFLTDRGLTRQIATAAELTSRDQVLEVGPGLGILTRTLAERSGRVVAFELDSALAAALPQLVPDSVTVVRGDALVLDPNDHFDGPYKVVANLPYQITSPFLFRYLGLATAPTLLVLMVQREVAERVAAGPGSLSYLAVAVQSAARPRIVRFVPPGAFYPRPKVESAVLRLDPLSEPLVPPADRRVFLTLVRAGFAQPRKQLLNSLGQGLGWARGDVAELLAQAGIAADRRPQTVTLTEWRTLHQRYASIAPDSVHGSPDARQARDVGGASRA